MTEMMFKRAVKKNLYARIALLGPTGSGKTYTAMRWAYALANGGKVAALDTEHGSLSKYAGMKVDGCEWRPDVIELESFSPEMYMNGIKLAEKLGYDVLVIDSLSHAWAGKDGTLEYVDKVAQRDGGGSFQAWRKGTNLQNEMVETILAAKLHIIATMRVKMDYVVEKDDRGKSSVRKVGLQPVQRDGVEYEFDLVCDLNSDNVLTVSKTRCPELNEKSYRKPDAEAMLILRKWLEGDPVQEQAQEQAATPKSSTTPANWTQDQKDVDAFLNWAGGLGCDKDEAAVALEVDNIADFTGDKKQAAAMVKSYLQRRAAIPVMESAK